MEIPVDAWNLEVFRWRRCRREWRFWFYADDLGSALKRAWNEDPDAKVKVISHGDQNPVYIDTT